MRICNSLAYGLVHLYATPGVMWCTDLLAQISPNGIFFFSSNFRPQTKVFDFFFFQSDAEKLKNYLNGRQKFEKDYFATISLLSPPYSNTFSFCLSTQ